VRIFVRLALSGFSGNAFLLPGSWFSLFQAYMIRTHYLLRASFLDESLQRTYSI
jgi:hypothetical protein